MVEKWAKNICFGNHDSFINIHCHSNYMKTNRIDWENPMWSGLKNCFNFDVVEENDFRIGRITINMDTGKFANMDNNELVLW